MSNNISLKISGTPEAVLRLLDSSKLHENEKPLPWWITETPWFERHGKLTPKEAADLEASTYGKGLNLEDWQINVIKRIYGDDAVTVPVTFIAGKHVR